MVRLAGRLVAVALTVVLTLAVAAPAGADDLVFLGGQLRVSFVGPDGPGGTSAFFTRVAYDPEANRYLVTFVAPPVGANSLHNEVFAQLVDAEGNRIGDPVQVSQTGDPSASNRRVAGPSPVAYNPASHEFIVVFASNRPPLDQNKFEVFGQRLDENGQPVGTDDFQISTTSGTRTANSPAIVLNSVSNEYLVGWVSQVDDNGNTEIITRRLDSSGGLAGLFPEQVSKSGTPGSALLAFQVGSPQIAYNPLANQYLVAWVTDRDGTSMSQKFEVNGQRMNAAGDQVGGFTDLEISQTGAPTDGNAGAFGASAAFNSVTGQYVVAWTVNGSSIPEADREVFGQRLAQDASPVPDDADVQLTDAAASPDFPFGSRPVPLSDGSWVLIYQGAPATDGLAAGKEEVWAQRLTAEAGRSGAALRVSETGIPGDADAEGTQPAAVPGRGSEVFTTWQADPGSGGLATNEAEIFGRRLGLLPPPDTRAPRTAFRLHRSYRLPRVVRRGLAFFATSDEAAAITGTATIPRRIARRLHIAARSRPVTVARLRRKSVAAPGRVRVTLRFTRKAKRRLAHARRVKLTVRLTATDAAGNAGKTAHATLLRGASRRLHTH